MPTIENYFVNVCKMKMDNCVERYNDLFFKRMLDLYPMTNWKFIKSKAEKDPELYNMHSKLEREVRSNHNLNTDQFCEVERSSSNDRVNDYWNSHKTFVNPTTTTIKMFNTERNSHGTGREFTTCITSENEKTCYGAEAFYCIASENKDNHPQLNLSDLSEGNTDFLVSIDCITEEL
jgi:hypothetical protein